MIHRPLVLLDVDGVLADFVSEYLDTIHALTGRQYTLDQVTDWDIDEALQLSADERTNMTHSVSGDPSFAQSLIPYEGAQEAVQQLREMANVVAITSPWSGNPTWMEQRSAWLGEHFGFRRRDVMHVNSVHKPLVSAHVLVDDKASRVKVWADAHPGAPAIVFAQPYNLAVPVGCTRGGWNHVLQVVRRLAEFREGSAR